MLRGHFSILRGSHCECSSDWKTVHIADISSALTDPFSRHGDPVRLATEVVGVFAGQAATADRAVNMSSPMATSVAVPRMHFQCQPHPNRAGAGSHPRSAVYRPRGLAVSMSCLSQHSPRIRRRPLQRVLPPASHLAVRPAILPDPTPEPTQPPVPTPSSPPAGSCATRRALFSVPRISESAAPFDAK